MLFIYRTLINLVYLISPLIIIFRVLKNKEHPSRFQEKIGFFSLKKINGKLIWFHGASVGELLSVVPLIEKFEKDSSIKQILVTSNTLSSSKIIEKMNLKKTIHQFFPIDTNYTSKKFINYWKPSKVFLIDSEIWPNMILNLKKREIPLILLNGRITKKTFNRWKFFPKFSKKIFSNFNLCFPASKESYSYLKRFGVKNVKFIGNLKFSQSETEIPKINNKIKDSLKKRKTWCASSTHQTEEAICAKAHIKLKEKFHNLITIIIPRHIERSDKIKKELEKLKLKVHLHTSNQNIKLNTDIYLVNSYGNTKTFYNHTNNVFLGGSLIKHGGQNPLEAARFGCNILTGPFVHNFTEIFKFLEKHKISKTISNEEKLTDKLRILLRKKHKVNKIKTKLEIIGKNILKNTYKEINLINHD